MADELSSGDALNKLARGISLAADAVVGKLMFVSVTLPVAANAVRKVGIPAWARGFKLYPNTNNAQFAIDADPVAFTTVAVGTADVALAALSVGGLAKKDAWEVRLLDPDRTGVHWLHLISAVASTVVDIEFF